MDNDKSLWISPLAGASIQKIESKSDVDETKEIDGDEFKE